MSTYFHTLFPALLLAHLLGDFILQSDQDAKNKHRLSVLLKHTGIIIFLSYVISGGWRVWEIPLLVGATHLLIDYIKSRFSPCSLLTFLIDQCAHLLSYAAIALLPFAYSASDFYFAKYTPYIILFSGFIAATQVSGHCIELYMEKLPSISGNDGLPNGGAIIGKLERALIFLMVLVGHAGNVGFLIAAKSILRFGQINQKDTREISEYIIIGTLLSFGLGLAFSYFSLYFYV